MLFCRVNFGKLYFSFFFAFMNTASYQRFRLHTSDGKEAFISRIQALFTNILHIGVWAIVVICLTPRCCFGQSQESHSATQNTNHEFSISLSLLPASKMSRDVWFQAIDQAPTNTLRDTMQRTFRSRPVEGEFGITLRYAVRLEQGWTLGIAASPYFGSFASEDDKKDRMYGIQFDAALGYRFALLQSSNGSYLLALEPSCKIAYTIGGYSLGTFAGVKKEWLQFGDTKFYDPETAFHLIDNNLGVVPSFKVLLHLGSGVAICAEAGWMLNLSRRTEYNIAGYIEDKQTVRWQALPLSTDTLIFTADSERISQRTLENFSRFTGINTSIGLVFTL